MKQKVTFCKAEAGIANEMKEEISRGVRGHALPPPQDFVSRD